MKKGFLAFLLLLTIVSCGKKRAIISEGETTIGILCVHYQEYWENDTFYKAFTDESQLVVLLIANSEAEFRDSTFTRKTFPITNELYSIEVFKNGKLEGDVLTFYGSGKKKSRTSYLHGFKSGYETWYESGKKQVTGELLPDSTFLHREYFENGLPKQEMTADETGKGHCTVFHPNGKKREEGPMVNFNPVGIWKIYDTLGNVKQDTIFGIK
jgi:antitoxin component YwqK of YwqJK toxin-antitoxin module